MPPASRINLGALGKEPGFLLRLAQLQAYSIVLEGLDPGGLRPGAFSVLYLIAQNPGMRQGTLAKHLLIKRAQMTKLVQALAAQNLVARSVPAGDRRGVELALTPAGAALLAAHAPRFLAQGDAALPGLSAGETRTLKTLLAKTLGLQVAL
ncbi:MAG: MarR family transcriptional regulator [Pseudomonadota bacterium]